MDSSQARSEIISICDVIATWADVASAIGKAQKIKDLLRHVTDLPLQDDDEIEEPSELWRFLYLRELSRAEQMDIGECDSESERLSKVGQLASQRATILYNAAYEHLSSNGT